MKNIFQAVKKKPVEMVEITSENIEEIKTILTKRIGQKGLDDQIADQNYYLNLDCEIGNYFPIGESYCISKEFFIKNYRVILWSDND